MILGWGIRLKYQQSLEGVGQNECVSYWLLLTIMTRHNREQAMSRGVSLRDTRTAFVLDRLALRGNLEIFDSTLFEKTAHDSNKDAHNQSVCVVNSRRKERLEK